MTTSAQNVRVAFFIARAVLFVYALTPVCTANATSGLVPFAVDVSDGYKVSGCNGFIFSICCEDSVDRSWCLGDDEATDAFVSYFDSPNHVILCQQPDQLTVTREADWHSPVPFDDVNVWAFDKTKETLIGPLKGTAISAYLDENQITFSRWITAEELTQEVVDRRRRFEWLIVPVVVVIWLVCLILTPPYIYVATVLACLLWYWSSAERRRNARQSLTDDLAG